MACNKLGGSLDLQLEEASLSSLIVSDAKSLAITVTAPFHNICELFHLRVKLLDV